MNARRFALISIPALLLGTAFVAAAEPERAMFGNTPSRNMVSDEKGVPDDWDPKTGRNILWVAELGSQTYSGPVVAGGKVLVGSNNQREYNKELSGDRGNILVFSEKDGSLVWQAAHPKLPAGRVNDWPLQGICSTPAIEGDRVYYLSNRAELTCSDLEGFRDGENDGPFTDESEMRRVKQGEETVAKKIPLTGEIDEDVVWRLNLIDELDVFPHNLAASSPLVVGDLVFTITGQGVDETHVNIPSPLGASFVAANKNTGEVVWDSAAPGNNVLHGSWSSPSYGVIGGKPQVLFPGGDGWLYAFEPATGKELWKFDLNPPGSKWELGGRGTKNNVIAMAVVHDDMVYIGVGQDPEHGEAPGNFWAIAPAGKSGDITQSGAVWHRGGDDFHRTLSSAAIADGLVYIADLSGFLHCLDAKTGEEYWTYDAFAAIWGSAFVADGKVYLGDEDGDVAILRAGKKLELLREINMGNAVYTTPVVHDGTLFVASRTKLFAIRNGIPGKPATGATKSPS